jgi:NADH-quinone oxidoreductase subunit A
LDLTTASTAPLWPLLLYACAVLVIVGGMLGLSHLLGQRHREKETGEPYESGAAATGTARLDFSPRYYVVAMLFVVFDLEAAFIVVWAVAIREAGWMGYAGLAVFVVVLLAVLAYEWRAGALDFALKGRDVLRRYKRPVPAEGRR